jgi:hypothetical protein
MDEVITLSLQLVAGDSCQGVDSTAYIYRAYNLTQDCSFSAGTGWRKGIVDQRFIKGTV